VAPAHTSPATQGPKDLLREVARRRAAQIAGLVVVVLFTVLAFLARLSGDSLMGLPFTFWGPLAVILLLGKIAFNIAAWRCPSCGGSLGMSYGPRFCPSCGVRLKGGDSEEGTR
jgi:hypothetical protein